MWMKWENGWGGGVEVNGWGGGVKVNGWGGEGNQLGRASHVKKEC